MMALFTALATLGLFQVPASAAGSLQAGPCDDFYQVLAAVPHVSITRGDGELESTWDEHTFDGCQVDFQTNDSTLAGASAPDFWADDPDTDMYRAGWRMVPEILADGAGSGIYAVARRETRCVVRWEQPAYIDDDGTIVQSDTFTMRVQCEARPGA